MIWLEPLDRHLRRRADMHRVGVSGPVARIGRALDNDLVLDDPHVAAYHAELLQSEDGAWLLRDLGSVNGTRMDVEIAAPEARDPGATEPQASETQVLEPDLRLADGALLTLGLSRVRVRLLADDGVEAHPLPSRPQAQWLDLIDHHGWSFALLLTVLVSGYSVALVWLHELSTPQWTNWVMEPLTALCLLVGWATAWWVASKLVSGDGGFKRHLVLALLGGLLVIQIEPLERLIGFAWASTVVPDYSFMALWALGAWLVCLHLIVMGPRRQGFFMAGACVCGLLAALVQGAIQAEARRTDPSPHFARALLHPSLRVRPEVSAVELFDATAQMKAELEQERTKE